MENEAILMSSIFLFIHYLIGWQDLVDSAEEAASDVRFNVVSSIKPQTAID